MIKKIIPTAFPVLKRHPLWCIPDTQGIRMERHISAFIQTVTGGHVQ